MLTRSRILPALATMAVALSACGGGVAGGDDVAATPTESPAPSEPTPGPETSNPQAADPSGVDLGSQPRPTLGDPDAPVTLIEFSDFLCPFCEQFAADIEPELIERYVESGQVRIVWHDFPAKGRDSIAAAVAARAAHRQDAFWEYHRELFARKGSLDYSTESLTAIADDLGLDVDRFTDDLADPTLEQHVTDDFARGQRFGVRGTPSFLVGDTPVVGAQPISAFADAIEAQLGGSGQG